MGPHITRAKPMHCYLDKILALRLARDGGGWCRTRDPIARHIPCDPRGQGCGHTLDSDLCGDISGADTARLAETGLTLLGVSLVSSYTHRPSGAGDFVFYYA